MTPLQQRAINIVRDMLLEERSRVVMEIFELETERAGLLRKVEHLSMNQLVDFYEQQNGVT